MPKQLNNGAITQALQRAFGFKGRYIPMLDEVIVPVYVIADPSPAAITRLAAGTVVSTPGGVGSRATIELFNPVGSGVVVVVSNWTATADVKAKLDISFLDGSIGLPPLTTLAFRDRRVGGVPAAEILDNPQSQLQGTQVAALEVDGALAQTASWEAAAGDPRQPLVVLGEGQGIVMQNDDDQLAIVISANMRWLEIPITELSPSGGLP